MRRKIISAVFCTFLAAVLSLPEPLHAQGQAIDGVIEGVVRSNDGAPVPGAAVKARNRLTGLERSVQTNESGQYVIPLLPPGAYNVIAEASGFASLSRTGVEVAAGQVVTVPLVLSPAAVQTVVEVVAEIPVVEVGRTVVSNTQPEVLVRNVPIIGRSIQDFYTLQPGVNARPLSTGGSGTGTSTTIYGGLGLRQINVDGVSNQLQGGARNIVISQEAIQEFQTVTNFSAEFGRVAGGLQNAFTRSGSNDVHGSLFAFARHRALSARPKLLAPDAPKPDFSRYHAGGTLGGPLRKDRAFYFFTYERWMQDLPQILTISPENAALIGIPASSIGARIATFRAHTTTARADWLLNSANRIFVRHNFYFDRESPIGSGLNAFETLQRWDEEPQNLTMQWVSSARQGLLNELRFLWASRSISRGIEADKFAPNINIQGVASFNGNQNGEGWSRERGVQIINNTTWLAGRHTFKAGVDLLPVSFRERLTNINGQFVFGGLPAVPGVRPAVSALQQYLNTLAGVADPATGQPFSYSRFTQSIGREFHQSDVVQQGYFIQDDFRPSDRLKINAGLRYEYFRRPQGLLNPDLPQTGVIPQDRSNWAPRLGIAYDPWGDGKTVLRAGGGLYYNVTVAQTFNNFFRGNGVEVINLNVTPTSPGAPAFTRSRVAPPSGFVRPVSDVRFFAPVFHDVTVYNFFFTLERELVRDLGLNLTYQGTRGRHLPWSRIENLASTGRFLADGREVFSTANRPDPRFGNIFVAESSGTQNYNGLIATLNRRFSRGLSLQASYHLSRSYGKAFVDDFTGFGIFRTPHNARDLSMDWGTGEFDMRHRFILLGVWEPGRGRLTGPAAALLGGWQISTRVIAQTGLPFTATTGQDNNGDTVFNDRPAGQPVNAFRLPRYDIFDLRLSRIFRISEGGRLEFIAESFNALNRTNITNVNRVWGPNPAPNATFNTPVTAENQRQFQLAVRYSF